MKKWMVLLLAAVMLCVSCMTCALADNVTNVDFLNCWKGSSASFPDDMDASLAGQMLAEKFGIRLNLADSGAASEKELLNMLLTGGELPDVINSAYWNANAGGTGAMAIEAAKEGMVKDISSYLVDYPNLAAVVEQLQTYSSKSVWDNLFGNEEYPEGAVYFLPQGLNTNSEEYSTVYGDTMYARQDVLDQLGVKAEDIKTMDDLYVLAVKVKEAGLTDWNGNPMIPMSTLQGGWRQDNIYGWLRGNTLSDYRQLEDGTVVHVAFTDYYADRVNYMRKLYAEGLLDVTCLDITTDESNSKLMQGCYAIVTADCNNISSRFYNLGLAEAHPESIWVPLGLTNQDGNNCVDVWQPGFTGGHILWFSADIEEDALRGMLSLLDWVCTDEGKLWIKYGVEGEHYEMVDGLPVVKAEWAEKTAADSNLERNSMVGSCGLHGYVLIEDNYSTLWPVAIEDMEPISAYKETLDKYFRPRAEVDALSVKELLKKWSGYSVYNDALSSMDIGAKLNQAYFYETEEEVNALIESIRENLRKIGVEEACAFIQENMSPAYAF